MRTILALSAAVLMTAGAVAQELSPAGTWRDSYGTTLQISLCGQANTDVCVVLLDVQGESRTEENLAFVNTQIMQAPMTAANEWRGAVNFLGQQADGRLRQVSPTRVEIQGCRALIFCQTLAFDKV